MRVFGLYSEWEECTMQEWDQYGEGSRNIYLVGSEVVFVKRTKYTDNYTANCLN